MFAAWCHVAAAIAWDLGWRPVPEKRDQFSFPPYDERQQLVDMVIFFASGRELSEDVGRFRQRRIIADAQRMARRLFPVIV